MINVINNLYIELSSIQTELQNNDRILVLKAIKQLSSFTNRIGFTFIFQFNQLITVIVQKMIVANKDQKGEVEWRVGKMNKEKKIKKLLKKIPYVLNIPKLICLQNYFQISQSAIINQSSLRDPQNCTQSLLTNTFYFKRIGSMLINQNFLQLNLKDIISPKLPINYFIERYRSFGDKEFNDMSLMFEKIVKQFQYLSTSSRVASLGTLPKKQFFENALNNYLNTIKDKNFILFFYQPSHLGISLKKFIFSKKLLDLVGLDIQEISNDYVKHKHVFFQIFGCQIYKQIITKATVQMGNMMEETRLGKTKLQDALFRINMNFKSFIHRRKNVNGMIFQQEIQASIKLYKPSFFMTVIEITDLDEEKIVRMYPLKKQSIQLTSQEKIAVSSMDED